MWAAAAALVGMLLGGKSRYSPSTQQRGRHAWSPLRAWRACAGGLLRPSRAAVEYLVACDGRRATCRAWGPCGNSSRSTRGRHRESYQVITIQACSQSAWRAG